MARIHRPPPPVPDAEDEETEDNYGVWSETEFDDGEVYENYEKDEENEENNSDYEEPDDTGNLPNSQRAASPAQPPVPPRRGGPGHSPVPNHSLLMPMGNKIPAGGHVSPRVSPSPTEKRKCVPQPPVAIIDDDEMYEAVDSPLAPCPIDDDDGEVYSEVDAEPQKPIAEKRALPAFPKSGFARPLVPNPPNLLQPLDAKSSKSSVSPKMGKREVPAPPSVKSTPPNNRNFTPGRTIPQPSLPPSPPEILRNDENETEELYEEGDFYVEKESTQAFSTKPLPRPPQNDDVEQDDEYYTEVPELSKPSGPRSKADRSIPAIPQPQRSPMQPSAAAPGLGLSAKLKAGLAQLAEAKAIAAADDQDSGKSMEDSVVGSFSGNALLNAKKLLKPVSRGESLNSAGKPATVSVKRTESESSKAVKGFSENKMLGISDMKNKLESRQKEFGKPNAKLLPTTCYEEAEPVKKSPTLDRKPFQNAAGLKALKPLSPVSARRPLVTKSEANDNLAPPKVPAARNSPNRNAIPKSDLSVNLDSTNCPTKVNAHLVKDRTLPPVPSPSAEGLGGLYSLNWYFSAIERQNAERKVLDINQDGAFLVRKSQRGGDVNPYTLTLLYSGHVYNLHIRKRKDGKFALGTEKSDEHVFNAVEDLINFHNNNPIEVVGDPRKNIAPGKVVLKASPKKGN